MSITRAASETSRTSKDSGIVAQGCGFVVRDGHELGQARDLEDVAVVLRQPERAYVQPILPGLSQKPHDQGDAGAVDVFGPFKIEDHGAQGGSRGLDVGLVEHRFGGPVDVPRQVDHDGCVALAYGGLQLRRCHPPPPSRRRTSSRVRLPPSLVTRASSTIFSIRNRPQPRGFWRPSSLASMSGVSGSADSVASPQSAICTRRRSGLWRTRIHTGLLGPNSLPCSIAFIVASPTAVFSRSRRAGSRRTSAIALATRSIASRSLPGALGN